MVNVEGIEGGAEAFILENVSHSSASLAENTTEENDHHFVRNIHLAKSNLCYDTMVVMVLISPYPITTLH